MNDNILQFQTIRTTAVKRDYADGIVGDAYKAAKREMMKEMMIQSSSLIDD